MRRRKVVLIYLHLNRVGANPDPNQVSSAITNTVKFAYGIALSIGEFAKCNMQYKQLTKKLYRNKRVILFDKSDGKTIHTVDKYIVVEYSYYYKK